MADLMRFMRQEEAIKAMHLFEGAQEHCRVSKRSLKNWVVMILLPYYLSCIELSLISADKITFLTYSYGSFCR